MKKLFVVRHARAEEKSASGDFKRALLKSGRRDAKAMAKQLKKLAELPEVILTSSAKRAVETAEIFADVFKIKKRKVQPHQALYDSGADAILARLRELPEEIPSAMVVGHVPVLNQLTHSLISNFTEEIPTSGVVGIDLNIEKWAELKDGVGSLLFFEYPQTKAKNASSSKTIRQRLQKSIGAAVDKELKKVDSQIAKLMTSSVQKASVKMSKKFSRLLKAVQKESAKDERKKSKMAADEKISAKPKKERKTQK